MVSLAMVAPWLGTREVSPSTTIDARKGHVEFFRDDLAERGADAGAEIDMAVEGGDRAVGGYLDEGFESAFAGCGRANDGQRSRQNFRHQSCASATMARRAHRRAHDFNMRAAPAQIVAQRFEHLGLGRARGLRSSSALVLMIMPLRQ